jgi:TatD DNase family protein
MIDFHCHLDLYSDPNAVVAEVVRRRTYVLSVTTVPSAFQGTLKLAPAGGRIRTALGLHPALAAKRSGELELFERLLPQTRYVGEIGLDASRDHKGSFEAQQSVFRDILDLCGRAGGKVLSVHSRGAHAILLDELAAQMRGNLPILHWFVGNSKQIARAAEMGCWFSVGPSMLASKAGRAAFSAMPIDRVLPESDGPFATMDDRGLMPWEAWNILPTLAQTWGLPIEQVTIQIKENFRTLANFAG